MDVGTAMARDLRGAFVREHSIGDPGLTDQVLPRSMSTGRIKTAEAAPEARQREAKPAQDGGEPGPKAEPKKQIVPKSASKRALNEPGVMRIKCCTLNVEIAADWTEEQIRERIAAVKRAAEAAGQGEP